MPLSPDEALEELFAAPAAGEASAAGALHARVAQRARAQEMAVLDLGAEAPGEVLDLSRVLAAMAFQALRHGRAAVPTLILSSGEARIAGRPAGAAGFLLVLARALDAHPAVHGLAARGVWPAGEGAAPLAPMAFRVGPDTLARAQRQGWNPGRAGSEHEAAALFARLDACQAFAWDLAGTSVVRALLLT